MKLQDVIFVLILALTRCPPNVAKYIVYSLANGQMNDEELTCDSTCHYHGLQCSTTGFDCHAAAVKHCGGKELTLLIRGTCELDLCNVNSTNTIFLFELSLTPFSPILSEGGL